MAMTLSNVHNDVKLFELVLERGSGCGIDERVLLLLLRGSGQPRRHPGIDLLIY